MNWDALGAIGEIVGAVAVVVTLAYLARQVSDNSKQVKLNTTQSFASLAQDGFAPIYNSADTLRVFNVGIQDPGSLSEVDLATFFYFMDRLLNNVVPLLADYRAGVMSDAEFSHYRALYQELIDSPGGAIWRQARPRPSFQRALDELTALS